MTEMAYKAYDGKGALVQGTAQGENEQEIRASFLRRGLYLVALSSQKEKGNYLSEKWKSYFNRVKLNDLIIFTRQFNTLFKAGLGVDILLGTLAKQTQNKALKVALLKIRDEVNHGSSLSKAFAKHPKIFNSLYVNMLVAGEEAGILEQVLAEISTVLEKEDKLGREVGSATLYPKIVLGVMVISIYVMTTFIIPKFASFYDKFQATLPLPTRILMGVSYFASHYWYLVLILSGVAGFLLFRFLRSDVGKLKWDRLKLKFPIFGDLFQKIAMARFGHLFAALYRSGLPLVRSFDILRSVIGNEAYALEIKGFRDEILKGKSIAEVMRTSKCFSPIMVETTAIGEQSGNLDEMLSSMADHFDLEVSHITKNLSTLLEPILLMFLFGMVTLMALGIFLPMWNLSKVVMK